MFVEKKRLGIPPRLLTANGDNNGTVTLADTRGFFVGQIVELSSDTQQPRQLKIKRFVNSTTFKVGPLGSPIVTFSPTSDFLVSDNAKILAAEQDRPGITDKDYNRAVYAEEPIVAKRVIEVDEYGNYYSAENPFPVQLSDGSINIGTVNAELEVQLSHLDNDPDLGDVHDSVRIGDGVDVAQINPDGSFSTTIVNKGFTRNIYEEVSGVISGIETVLVDLVASPGKLQNLQRVQFSGTQIANYKVYINGIAVASTRTHHGSGLSGEITFVGGIQEGIVLVTGDVVELRVLHNRNGSGIFEGRIQTSEVELITIPFDLLSENGDSLVTESNDNIILEQ